jgi:hypothetical protein
MRAGQRANPERPSGGPEGAQLGSRATQGGSCLLPFIRVHPGLAWPLRNSHRSWLNWWGSRQPGGTRGESDSLRAEWHTMPTLRPWVPISWPTEIAADQVQNESAWEVRPVDRPVEVRLKPSAKFLSGQLLLRAPDSGSTIAYAALKDWPAQASVLPKPLLDEAARVVDAAQVDTTRYWDAHALDLTSCSKSELPQRVQGWFSRTSQQYPEASLWLVTAPALSATQAAVRALYSIRHLSQLGPSFPEVGFAAARGLFSKRGMALGHYVEPGLCSLAPQLLGMAPGRAGGLIMTLFGEAVTLPAGGGSAASIFELLSPNAAIGLRLTSAKPALSALQIESFMEWWIERINEALCTLYNPAQYAASGTYDPARHFAAMLSFDRLLAGIQEILIQTRRDDFARRLAFYAVTDLMPAMGVNGDEALFDSSKLHERLKEIEAHLPDAARYVFMGRLRRGLQAVDDLPMQCFTSPPESPNAVVQTSEGKDITRGKDKIAASYLRILRDTTHGFSRKFEGPRERSILSSFTGEIHPEVADVGLLYLLHLLTNPTAFHPC